MFRNFKVIGSRRLQGTYTPRRIACRRQETAPTPHVLSCTPLVQSSTIAPAWTVLKDKTQRPLFANGRRDARFCVSTT